MKPLEHIAISASAGSGKTFQLATRCLQLFAAGVPPDRIAALTFSRKAAGEIFESIVKRLGQAASGDAEAAATAEQIGRPELARAEFLALLKRFTSSLHRLHIGTLDSFIVGVARAFPAELGIPSEFTVADTDGPGAVDLQVRALDAIFSPQRTGAREQRSFLEAFKRATFGREEKNPAALLAELVRDCRERYRVLPEPDAWGNPQRIWPDGCPWLQAGPQDVGPLALRLQAWADRQDMPDRLRKRWAEFLAAAAGHAAGEPWSKPLGYLLEKLLIVVDGLRAGRATVEMERKACTLEGEAAGLALGIVSEIVRREISASLEQTRGLHDLLSRYEETYDAVARERGQFTFQDVQYLLTPANAASGGAVLSRTPGAEGRLYIDYRLDCRLDHWLIDEFQDTSDLQWSVLSNLADEILQDDGARRSFFYVGDVKQAIYGWRGGNARLFDAILRAYPGRIRRLPLNASFRSCAPVIATVNRVFSSLADTDFPEKTAADWSALWSEHTCREGRVPAEGYAAVLEPPPGPDGAKPDAEDRAAAAAAILAEIDPLAQRLTAAVLVRSNKTGHDVTAALRRLCPGMSVVHEGNTGILDNPALSLLLSLVQYAAHPGDGFARRHLEMSPLAPALDLRGPGRGRLCARLLREIHEGAFRGFCSRWGAELKRAGALDAFGRMRLEDLLAAAEAFDAGGSRDADAFLRFATGRQISELAAGAAVRVMTVHQAKGLEFDLVILPDLMGGDMTRADTGFVAARGPDDARPRWALRMPRRAVADADPVLAREAAVAEENAAFDELCVLYVAMTRASRALYAVTSYPGPSSEAFTPAAFLKSRLAGDPKPTDGPRVAVGGRDLVLLYEEGRRDWHRRLPPRGRPPAPPPAQALAPDFAEHPSARRRLLRVEPSAREEITRAASSLFKAETRDVLDFGSAIHAMFERIEWIEDADAARILREQAARAGVTDAVRRDAAEQFRRALDSPEVRAALSRPPGRCILWREKAFEVLIEDGQWISGAFDRVTVEEDAGGRPVRATVLDYKSDRIGEPRQFDAALDRHRPQLLLYRQALSRILRLPESAIAVRVLFTRAGRVMEV